MDKFMTRVEYGKNSLATLALNNSLSSSGRSQCSFSFSGGKWINNRKSVDNVGSALLTMFEIAGTEGWADAMFAAVDATVVMKNPVRDYNPAWYV